MLDFNEKSYEIINGEIVHLMPGTSDHARVSKYLTKEMDRYFDNINTECEVFNENIKIYLKGDSSEDYVIPDVAVLCDRSKFSKRGYEGVPALIAEILSPSTAKKDRTDKLELYKQYGVREYWLITIGEKCIEQYVLENGNYKIIDILFLSSDVNNIVSKVFPELVVDLNNVFKNLLP